MAISIDTVYQRVLAFANKEQRGYITPQEFNLFANQAQMEIFEQYFYDLNQFARVPGNDTVYADVDEMLEEKIQVFDDEDGLSTILTYGTPVANTNIKSLPDYIYRVHRVEFQGSDCEIVNSKDFRKLVTATGLLAPTNSLNMKTGIVNIKSNTIRLYVDGLYRTPSFVFYIRKPKTVSWGYFVINDKALYDPDPNKTTDFELHDSEETELVYKILKYAGLSMQRNDIVQGGQGLESLQTQQEKQ